jgi:hypothetical protein
MVADTGNPDRGNLPQLVILYLRNGDIELILKTRRNRFDDTTLILQRLTLRNMYLQLTDANIHDNPVCRPDAITGKCSRWRLAGDLLFIYYRSGFDDA